MKIKIIIAAVWSLFAAVFVVLVYGGTRTDEFKYAFTDDMPLKLLSDCPVIARANDDDP